MVRMSSRSRGAREKPTVTCSTMRREGLTVRELAQRLGGYAGLAFVGTPAGIADEMGEWLTAGAADGFTVMFPYLPGASTTSSARSCRSCNGAACSGASTRAARCATTSACRGRRTEFF